MSITIARGGPLATLTLSRPAVRNALDPAMVASLGAAFAELAADDAVRAVVLTGAGEAFCAGGDLGWARSRPAWSEQENLADAEAIARMLEAAWTFPKPLIGRVNGAAIGSGAGLVACCDIALAADSAQLGFSEVKLGLIPAVVAQYIVPTIGVGHARALFVSGERISAERAFEIGLVHGVAPADELDDLVAAVAARVVTSAPQAVAAAKRLVDAVWTLDRDAARRYAVEAIVQARAGAESQEGVRAFLEKRRPGWTSGGSGGAAKP
jgi:methylglutaconyl-CoA hydratase